MPLHSNTSLYGEILEVRKRVSRTTQTCPDRRRMRQAFLRALGQPPQVVRRNARAKLLADSSNRHRVSQVDTGALNWLARACGFRRPAQLAPELSRHRRKIVRARFFPLVPIHADLIQVHSSTTRRRRIQRKDTGEPWPPARLKPPQCLLKFRKTSNIGVSFRLVITGVRSFLARLLRLPS